MLLEIGLVLSVSLLAAGAEANPAPLVHPELLPTDFPTREKLLLRLPTSVAETKLCPNSVRVLLLYRKGRWVEKNQISPIKRLTI